MNYEDLTISPAVTSILTSIGNVTVQGGAAGVSTELQVHVAGLMRIAALSVATVGGLPPCQLASPHTSIQTGYDSQGNLRFECLHTPMHCWDLNGHKGRC